MKDDDDVPDPDAAQMPTTTDAAWPNRYIMTAFEKQYIEGQCSRDGDGCLIVPPKSTISTIIENGQHIEFLSKRVNTDAVRSHLRKVHDQDHRGQ